MSGYDGSGALGSDVTVTLFARPPRCVNGSFHFAGYAGAITAHSQPRASIPSTESAVTTLTPFTSGYSEAYRSEMSKHSRAEAMALLDVFGYVDSNGDGWRELPGGAPLVLRRASLPDQRSRRQNEVWRKYLAAVGVRMEFDIATWPDLLKKARAGTLMMWSFSWVAGSPDGQNLQAHAADRFHVLVNN